jgi:lysophospholipase L1-like esterase
MKNYKYIGLLLLSIGVASCDVNKALDIIEAEVIPEVALNKNGLDFSKYISVGASFTAGYTDGAMFKAAQENSFPNILAGKFGTEFNQPLMDDNIGGLLYGGTQIQEPRFYFDGAGPARLDVTPTTETTTKLTGDYQNYGIPGAKSYHLLAPGFGSVPGVLAKTANPYFTRFSSSETTSVLEDVIAQSPTFFTLSEIGGNDVLGFALSGGESDTTSDDYDPITPTATFDFAFSTLVTTLTSGGAKGVVSNVPYITSLANFTTVPYNPVPLDAATATALNAAFTGYNGGLQTALSLGYIDQNEVTERTINFVAGNNSVTIVDEYLTDLSALGIPSYRQSTADDLLILASSAVIGEVDVDYMTTLISQGLSAELAGQSSVQGLSYPLADKWVLLPEEQEAIKTATDAYNTTIASVASANENIVMVDLNSVLTEAATSGVVFDDYTLTTSLVTGGLISLDGVHLTSRGYALMANKILEAMDAGFGSNFTTATNGLAKAGDYPTNYSAMLK